MANTYSFARLFVPQAEIDVFNDMMAGCQIEGCTDKMPRVPAWPTGTVKVYKPDGSIDMAAMPTPSGWIADGWFNDAVLDLLPEYILTEAP